jgi:hypothetical protein
MREPFFVPRPKLAFRVGVTGLRLLAPDEIEPLSHRVGAMLATIAQTIRDLAARKEALQTYDSNAPLDLRLISPLAEGADRIAAEVALEQNYRLYAALPFERSEYEKDFPDTLGDFHKLLAQADEILELDGARGPYETQSYLEVGHFVARNCDLLIAIWDGGPEVGVGGTAEIVRFSVDEGVPVWWLPAHGAGAPRFVESRAQLRPDSPATKQDAQGRLEHYLKEVILPPYTHAHESRGIFEAIASLFGGRRNTSLQIYLKEKPPHFDFLYRAHKAMMWFLSNSLRGNEERQDHSWWQPHYGAADRLSIAYGDRYRSSYVLVAFFAFLSVMAASIGSAIPSLGEVGERTELLFLMLIFLLVLLNEALDWHRKWMSYRLLAEFCRKQAVLAPFGRVLPRGAIQELARNPDTEDLDAPPQREAWALWLFTALSRSAPLPQGTIAAKMPDARRALAQLIETQATYQRGRRACNKSADKKVALLGEILFFLTLIISITNLALHPLHIEIDSDLLSAAIRITSAAAVAFLMLKAYSEFSLLMRHSSRMALRLDQARQDLANIPEKGPLLSRDLGDLMRSLALEMMREVSGWSELFRAKRVEPG